MSCACSRENAATELDVIMVQRMLFYVTLLIDQICFTNMCAAIVQMHTNLENDTDMNWMCYEMLSRFLLWVERSWNLLMLRVIFSKSSRNYLLWLPNIRLICTKLDFHSSFDSKRGKFLKRGKFSNSTFILPLNDQNLYTIDRTGDSWWYKQSSQLSPSGKYLRILVTKPLPYKHIICYLQRFYIFTFKIILNGTKSVYHIMVYLSRHRFFTNRNYKYSYL